MYPSRYNEIQAIIFILLCLHGIRTRSKNQILLFLFFISTLISHYQWLLKNEQVIITNSLEPTNALVIINTNNIVKLTFTNYLSWKLKVEAFLICYDIYKFIDGSNHSPPSTITTNDVKSSSLKFQSWFRQDKFIFGALVGSLTPSLIPLIFQSCKSKVVWDFLANTHTIPSRGHIKQIKGKNQARNKRHQEYLIIHEVHHRSCR